MNKAFIASTALILSTFSPLIAQQTASFRGGAAHAGVYAGAGAAAQGVVRWRFASTGQINASPAVVGASIFFGSADGFFYALDKRSGKQLWKFETKGRVVSSPAVAEGVVYFGSYDGFFYALDAATGALKWKRQTAGERRFAGRHLHGSMPADEVLSDPWDCWLSSPVVGEGVVYFGSGDGNVYAFKTTDGAQQWKFKTGDVVHSSPALVDGVLYVGSWDRNLYALDAKSGAEKWRFTTGDDPDAHNQIGIQSSPAVADGVVYFGCRDSHLYAVEATSGKKLWEIPTNGSWVVNSPAVRAGRVYFATSDSGQMMEADAKTGKILRQISLKGWPSFSSPSLAGDMLYMGSTGGWLNAIDLAKGEVAWRQMTESAKKLAPEYTKPDGSADYFKPFTSSFADDMYIGYGKLLELGEVLSSPVVDDDTVYFGSTEGAMYAVELKASK